MDNPNAKELAMMFAARFNKIATLRALVSEGIQKGHMKLQLKPLLHI